MRIDAVKSVKLAVAGEVHALQVRQAWLVRGAGAAAGGVQWRRPRPGGSWRLNLDGPDEETYITLMRLHRELNDTGTVSVMMASGTVLAGEGEAVSVAPGAAVLIGCTDLVET